MVIYAEKYFEEMQEAIENIDQDIVDKVIGIWKVFQNTNINFRLGDNRIFIIGNGGSHAIAEHISTPLTSFEYSIL